MRNGRTARTVWNVLEGTHIHRSRNMYGFIHNDVPSALTDSSGFPTDGECLLISTASKAAIEPGNVQCGPRGRARSGGVDRHWSGARAGMRDPRPVTRARPGGFCRTIRVPISVWAIHVTSWGQSRIFPLSGMALPETVRWFPAKVGGLSFVFSSIDPAWSES